MLYITLQTCNYYHVERSKQVRNSHDPIKSCEAVVLTLFYFSVLLAVSEDKIHKGFDYKTLEDNELNETQKF